MPEAHYSVTIQRPIGAVFEYVADGEKGSEWRPGVLEITRVSGSGVATLPSSSIVKRTLGAFVFYRSAHVRSMVSTKGDGRRPDECRSRVIAASGRPVG